MLRESTSALTSVLFGSTATSASSLAHDYVGGLSRETFGIRCWNSGCCAVRILCWQNAGSAEKSHENKKDGVRLFLLFMIVFPLQSERNGDAILWQKHMGKVIAIHGVTPRQIRFETMNSHYCLLAPSSPVAADVPVTVVEQAA